MSLGSFTFRWRLHLLPVLVWLGALACVIMLLTRRTQRFEVLGVARGQIHQIATTCPARLNTVNVQLFDTVEDPHEMNDIAGEKENAAIVKELSKKLYAWMEAVGDPMLDGAVQSPYYRQSMDAFRKTVQ